MLRRDLITKSLENHTAWLGQFDARRVKSFNQRCRSDREAAACEALITEYLRSRVDAIEPAEDISFGGPDLRCVRRGQPFYVEITSLNTKAVSEAIWIPDDANWEGGAVGSISEIVRRAVCGKANQCLRPDAPTVIAIGSHHLWLDVNESLVEELLISDVAYEVQVSRTNPVPREPGKIVTRLRNALFRRIKNEAVENAREYVAGVIVFGLCRLPLEVIGVINDEPTRSFDPSLLPEIRFATTVDVNGGLAIRWLDP
jgi:hypothetical protein